MMAAHDYLAGNIGRIQNEYMLRKQKSGDLMEKADLLVTRETDCDVRTALQYLFTHMPFSDLQNYDVEIYRDFAEHGVSLWREKAAVRGYPEEIYLNYILFHRVNEEEIAECRSCFNEMITEYLISEKDCNRGTMKPGISEEAEMALQINWWCAEHVTYHSTDERTRSAMAVFRSGFGRCGEESVFTVNALRCMGIPARQVYVPRWAHCDDNHAWVEMYIDGAWHFTGACEPETAMDRGWFNAAASRAMMVHARWFDSVSPRDEEIIGHDGIVTLLNELQRYAKTAVLHIHVQDENERALCGLRIQCSILNYCEFSRIAILKTDDSGNAEFRTGMGSVFLETCMPDTGDEPYDYSYMLADVSDRTSVTLTVKHMTEENKDIKYLAEKNRQKFLWTDFEMIAPSEKTITALEVLPDVEAQKKKRLEETARRRTKMHSTDSNPSLLMFVDGGQSDSERRLRAQLVEILKDKDRTDISLEVLEDAWTAVRSSSAGEEASGRKNYADNILLKKVLNPRAGNEILRPCRKLISAFFTRDERIGFMNNPEALAGELHKRIHGCDEEERSTVLTVPSASLISGIGSPDSVKILLVEILRTFGIPSDINDENGEVEYWKDSVTVFPAGDLRNEAAVQIEQGGVPCGFQWKYSENWTIARYAGGNFRTLDLSRREFSDRKMKLTLPAGLYRIITSRRLPDGGQIGSFCSFRLKADSAAAVSLRFRNYRMAEHLIRALLPPAELKISGGQQTSLAQLTENGVFMFAWLGESSEPTEHLLNEMIDHISEYRTRSAHICFVIRSETAMTDPMIAKIHRELPDIRIAVDSGFDTLEPIGRKMYTDFSRLPLVLIADREGYGVYACSGYNVGTGSLLLQVLQLVI